MSPAHDRKAPDGSGEHDGSGAERRRFPRVLVNLEVDYRAEDTFLFAYIRDISAMGIFVRTLTPEPTGTRLNLRFSPPGCDEPLDLEGVVIWINPYRPGDHENLNPGMGVQFVDLAPEQRERLTEFVKTFAFLADERDDAEASGGDAEASDDAAEASDDAAAAGDAEVGTVGTAPGSDLGHLDDVVDREAPAALGAAARNAARKPS